MSDNNDGWEDNGDDGDDGWDYGDEEDKMGEAMEQIPAPTKMAKAGSINQTEIRCFTLQELIKQEMPKQIEGANQTLCLEEDQVLAVLRHFDWNLTRLEEQWYDNIDQLKLKIGIEYDKSLNGKYPDITERLAANNGNMCNVMFMEFDPDDDDMRADECICGHQFSAICWTNHLKEKVRSQGAICMFARCP